MVIFARFSASYVLATARFAPFFIAILIASYAAVFIFSALDSMDSSGSGGVFLSGGLSVDIFGVSSGIF